MPPANDVFAAALDASPLPFVRTGIDTRAAGAAETGEPTPTCAPLGGSVWLRHTPTVSGDLVVDTDR